MRGALLAVALCVSSLPAMAGSTLFSDLGPAGNVYNSGIGWSINGSGFSGTSRQTGSCVLLLAMTGELSGFRGAHETAEQAQI